MSRPIAVFAIWCSLLAAPVTVWAQPMATGPKLTTRIQLELLTDSDAAVQAQRWLKLLEDFGIDVQMRQPRFGDKPEVKESVQGTLRWVTVIGSLDRKGTLHFSDRSFSPDDGGAKFKEWINELKLYGAKGAPDGQPMWGLDEKEFKKIYVSLAPIVAENVAGQSLEDLLKSCNIPAELPVTWSAEATKLLRTNPAQTVRQNLVGLSKGTILSIGLNDRGFGFRPLRTPEGKIELLIEPLVIANTDPAAGSAKISAKRRTVVMWPIGWPVEQSRQRLAPKLFEFVPVDLQKVPLADVLEIAAEATAIPILVDYPELARLNVDLQKVKVSHPPKKVAWFVALDNLVHQARLISQLWADEGGRPFLWITAIEPLRERKQPAGTKP